MCDDPEPEDTGEDDQQNEDPSEDEEFLDGLARELFGDDPFFADDPDGDEDRAPTSGERLLYALGQLHRLHGRRRFPFDPQAFDIEDLARVLGVDDDLEFVMHDRNETYYHFPFEVLVVEPEQAFPWRLLTVFEWGVERELGS